MQIYVITSERKSELWTNEVHIIKQTFNSSCRKLQKIPLNSEKVALYLNKIFHSHNHRIQLVASIGTL